MAVVPERRRRSANRYTKLLERIFHAKHSVEKTRIEFAREEITEAAVATATPARGLYSALAPVARTGSAASVWLFNSAMSSSPRLPAACSRRSRFNT